ncbi:MAG: peptide chain release factor 1 [Chitinivibrionales bacterium]|nr:peptide chain release factor 1 [Chitinivibrionales bacterium]
MRDKVKKTLARHKELEELMASPEVIGDTGLMEKYGREYNSIAKNLPVFNEYLKTLERYQEAKELTENDSDRELLELAQEERAQIEENLPELEQRVRYLLVPKNPNDLKNAIMEIRAGTGGVEAGIFASDLYRMYSHFIEQKGWKQEILSSSYGEIGSIKEIVFMVSGEGVFGCLKYESGIHRVQRVPQTESQGRIHTSAASVVVLPEAGDFEMQIDPNELRIDVYRSSGPGGQSVNTTDSAVRIVHEPTGLTVTCQDEKSQHKNRAKALKVLKTRLYDMKLKEKEAKESATRRNMVGTGDRSEKIRTYNFPQGRVTDHRIGLTLYKLDSIMGGNLEEITDALTNADLNERIKVVKV